MSGLAENLKRLRKRAGLSRKEFATILNLSIQAYGHYENEKGVPGYKVLRFVDKAAFCNFIEAVIESEKWQMRSRVASTLRMLIYKGDNISTAEVPTDILEKL